jgi:hypothetical protein
VTTLELRISRRERLTDDMVADLQRRIPSVEVFATDDAWTCVLSGACWETSYYGPTRYAAVDAAHSTYYWPDPGHAIRTALDPKASANAE